MVQFRQYLQLTAGVFISALVVVTGCESSSVPPATGESNSGDQAAIEHDDGHSHDDSGESDVAAALAELGREDRLMAESQKYCAVMGTNLLGSMGKPLKLDVKGEAVFVCCAGCKSRALKDPDATLAAVAKLKADNSGSKP